MHSINYMYVLKTYLRHVSVQEDHRQGAQSASFKPNGSDKLLLTRFFCM